MAWKHAFWRKVAIARTTQIAPEEKERRIRKYQDEFRGEQEGIKSPRDLKGDPLEDESEK